MNFHDLKLPKELSKKKKLELYKCWILTPLEKGSDQRVLDLDWTCDRYGLSETAAVALEINKLGADYLLSHANDLLETFSQKCFVIMKVVLMSGTMDEDIIIPPENGSGFDTDPHYDPFMGALNATIRYRVADSEIKNYALVNISLEMDENTRLMSIKNIELQEQVINQAITGGGRKYYG